MKGGWIYILTNPPNGTLYAGATNDIARRVFDYRSGVKSVFTRRHGLHWLVYLERHEEILAVIQRENNIKSWLRAWKIRLMRGLNPGWEDLCDPFMR